MAGNETIIRNKIADYLDCGASGTAKFVLMGTGFNTLDENPQAQISTKAYVSDKNASSIIIGYETQFPFDTDLIKSQEPIMKLYEVGRNQLQGADAECDYVRVELFKGAEGGTSYPARKFRVAVEVSSIEGEGAQEMHVTGNLNSVGDFVDGTFDTASKVFAASVEAGGV